MKLPNGPKSPYWLQLIQWIADPVSYMETAVQRYGDIFTTPFGKNSRPLLYVSNPQALKQILSKDTKQLTAPGELNDILRPLIGNQSVIMLNGNRHQRRRQLLLPPFHGERMRAYGQLICDITEKVMDQFPVNKPFLARAAMQDISLQVILQAVFGLHEGERYQLFKQLTGSMLELFRFPLTSSFLFFRSLQQDLGPWSPWGYFHRQRQQLDELLFAEINERREQLEVDRTDILSLLMSARDEAGQPMTDVELRDELLTLLFAGHETTATALAWSLYWVHHLSEVREKLLKELDTLGDFPEPVSISRLPYLTAVCCETLRIYPVGMLTFPRVVQEPIELGGLQLEAGTQVVGCIYLTHQREDLYPQPKRFLPERFLERQFSPWEFLPFGGGSRRCVGEALAQFEMKLVLATVLSRYQIALADDRLVQPQRRGVTLAPAGGVKVVVKGKRQRQRQLNEPITSLV
ncbi:MAG: cytochrome P450 [Chroococcidiopsidaceae cyanobacterium CP_BM_RX_35]|nr:cytochrome P450 [Chroococcidiopsidaceae cyanobacterium CP_BM_RX_35]